MKRDLPSSPRRRIGAAGQTLVEYSLIAFLVILALFVAFAATGDALGRIFNEAVFSALGSEDQLITPDFSEDLAPGNAATAFQLTVDWVNQQTPEQLIQGTIEFVEPTDLPADYTPPVEPTAIPTNTVVPSPTYTPSHTPEDIAHELTFEDAYSVINGPNSESEPWYRLEGNSFIGLNAWTGRFFQDGTSDNPEEPLLYPSNLRYSRSWHEQPGQQQFISRGEDIPRIDERFFSAQLRREIFIRGEDQTLTFRVQNPGGGVRLYYQDSAGCDGFTPASNARNSTTTSDCMIFDHWSDAPPSEIQETITLPWRGTDPNDEDDLTEYVIWLEYYHRTGAANLNLSITAARVNQDDDGLNGAQVNCNWGVYEGDRTNVRDFSWNAAFGLQDDNFVDDQLCHLELRGYIEVNPDGKLRQYDENGQVIFANGEGAYGGADTPVALTFWHVWDLNNNTNVRLEVAEYPLMEDPENPGEFIRERGTDINGDGQDDDIPLTWQTAWNPSLSNTRNYEWTQVEVLLNQFTAGDTFTYRFVIENDGGGGGRKRWFVDDIRVGSRRLPVLTSTNPQPGNTFKICDNDGSQPGTVCESYWTFDDGTSKALQDFRTTGRWRLTSAGAFTGQGFGDDPGNRYSLEQGADLSGSPLDRRVYWMEFNKRIDVSDTTTDGTVFQVTADAPLDPNGDDGPPIISFYNSYNINDNVSLQIQYYDDSATPAEKEQGQAWKLLREIVNTGNSGEASTTSTYVQVPLFEREVADANGVGTRVFEDYDDGWTAWADGPLRVRFAMVVNENAISSAQNGWTIDNIMIERIDNIVYTEYPFGDSGGDNITVGRVANEEQTFSDVNTSRDRWVPTGTWGVSDRDGVGRRNGQWLFTDSPNGERYIAGSNSTLELRAPVDLNSDTEDNPASTACVTGPTVPECFNITNPGLVQDAAVNPQLTFWWYRDLGTSARFQVEIRGNGGASAPVRVWEYNYDETDRVQPAWERTEIALDPFIVDDPNSSIEDDITIIFRLDTSGDSVARGDGVYIDDIVLEDTPPQRTFRLWTGAKDDGNGNNIEGDGNDYVDSLDSRTRVGSDDDINVIDDGGGQWYERWYYGGNWFSDFYTYRYLGEGAEIIGDDDSEIEQSYIARSGFQVFHESPPTSPDPEDIDDAFLYERRSFNVLEMIRTIDMTLLETETTTGDPVGLATGGDDGSPILYWWARFDRGVEARMKVQVARRLDNPAVDRTDDPLTYGADELYGWSAWENVYITDDNSFQQYAWRRFEVNLANATIFNDVGNSTGVVRNYIGDEIRIRFVLDATNVADGGDARDGWFIDDVQVSARQPRIYTLPFVDEAESMGNWIAEGTWGLDVDKFRGSNSLPDIAGVDWTARYLNCDYRPVLGAGNSVSPAGGDRETGNCSEGELEQMIEDSRYRDLYYDTTYNTDNRWYLQNTINSLPFDYDFGRDGGPPNAPAGFEWSTNFAAEYQRTIRIQVPQLYQFYIRGDDGVRVGITPYPDDDEVENFVPNIIQPPIAGTGSYTDPNVNNGDPVPYDNLIDNGWRPQGPTVYTATIWLVPEADFTPKEYLLTVHYYQMGSGGEVGFGVSTPNGSFHDSPLEVPKDQATVDDERIPVPYDSVSALELNGLIDLRSANKPILTYYTQYDLNNLNARGYLEVSEDGGFTWTDNDLRGNVVTAGETIDANSSTEISGRRTDWQERTNTLEDYRGQLVTLRWRLSVNESLDRVRNEFNDGDNNIADGLYITDILVFDVQPNSPVPQIVIRPPFSTFVSRGESQQLSVVASGTGPLLYEWFRGEAPAEGTDPGEPGTVPAGNVAVGTNSPTYSPPSDLEPGLYQYWVRVSNAVSNADPNVFPAFVTPASEYRVVDCVPTNLGDCNTYRINLNGGDLPSRDDSRPSWFGTEGTAPEWDQGGVNFSGNRSANSRTQIDIPATSDNDFVLASINGVAREAVYERYHSTGSQANYRFPVEAGQYTVRLYMAEPNFDPPSAQGRFSVQLNGAPAQYRTGVTSQPLTNVDFITLIGDNYREAAVIELAPQLVTPSDGALTVSLINEDGKSTFVSGIEVFPVTSLRPEIVEDPQDTTVPNGGSAQLSVTATGANLTFQWYRGLTGDTSTPINTGGSITVNSAVNGLTGQSFLQINGVTGNTNYWVRVNGGPDGDVNYQVDSRDARISACTYNPNVNGSCGRWYINIANDDLDTDGSGTGSSYDDGQNDIAPDGTVWFPEGNGQTWDANGLATAQRARNNLNNFSFSGNASENHIPRDVYRTYAQDNNFNFSLDVNSPPGGGGGNGLYDVTVYMADRNNDRRRSVRITIEGVVVEEDYHPRDDGNCGSNAFCAVTFEDIAVTDGTINIQFERARPNAFGSDGRTPRVNALEVTLN